MKNILIVTSDMYLRSSVSEILSSVSDYNLLFASDFDHALSTILDTKLHLVLVHQNLGGLYGLDLIAVVGRVQPNLPFILFDDDISSRTAMAAFRLGARDYMTYPPRPHLLQIQINRCLSEPIVQDTQTSVKVVTPSIDYAQLLDPKQRALTLVLTKKEFQALHDMLEQTAAKIEANFIGIIDKNDNIVDAVGSLSSLDMRELKHIVGFDTQFNHKLADVIGTEHFTATFWEGVAYNVYIIQIMEDKATLVTIAPATIKAGALWFQLKKSVKKIRHIIQSEGPLAAFPIFT